MQQQPIASPYNAHSPASDVVRDIDLSGKTAIVTAAIPDWDWKRRAP